MLNMCQPIIGCAFVCADKIQRQTQTWTVAHRRKRFADIDVKAAGFHCISLYGNPRAVICIPDQVTQVVLITMRVFQQRKSTVMHGRK